MGRVKEIDLPTYDKFFKPLIQALQELGGSGSIEEINERVAIIAKLSAQQLEIPHKDGRTKFEYRMAWARTYLKKVGLLENSSRGVWVLLNTDVEVSSLNEAEILRKVRGERKPEKNEKKGDYKDEDEQIDFSNLPASDELYSDYWRDILLSSLYKLKPDAFERLAQRLLRESGFIQVEVTGRSGDGGIDGKGIVRINGFLSFHVVFQCKRYKGTITPSQIRDFRGAMQGRADKGLFITTGSFTRDAVKEATRDGAPPIDLIDGETLCEKLRELKLGVDIQLREVILVDSEWFEKL